MSSIRRRLGAWSIAWLLCQVASLSALVPQECCAAHSTSHDASHEASHGAAPGDLHAAAHGTAHGVTQDRSHGTATDTSAECPKAPAAAECPMGHAAGDACPMHQSGASEQAASDRTASDQTTADCVMRGMCNGPAVALASLFSIPGVLLDSSSTHADRSASAPAVGVAHLQTVLVTFDTPPPRS
jgi:hypothetical protein